MSHFPSPPGEVHSTDDLISQVAQDPQSWIRYTDELISYKERMSEEHALTKVRLEETEKGNVKLRS